MRIGLSTLLLLVTIAALATAIATKENEPELVTIEKYSDIWLLTEEQLARSLWEDKSKPPPLSHAKALETANKIVEYLSSREDEFRFRELLLESVSLVRVEINKQTWAYQIFVSTSTNSPEFTFLLLMDGSFAFDPDDYWPELNKVILDFDSENGVEFVTSTYE